MADAFSEIGFNPEIFLPEWKKSINSQEVSGRFGVKNNFKINFIPNLSIKGKFNIITFAIGSFFKSLNWNDKAIIITRNERVASLLKARWAYWKFDNLKFNNRSVLIYEIHLEKIESASFEDVRENETINEHLIWLEKNHPAEYSLFKENIESLGLTIDELKNSQLRFPRGQVY